MGEPPAGDGAAQAAEEARERLRQSRAGAKRAVKLAGRLDGLPGTSRALAGGDITPQHARIIAEAAEAADVDEGELLEAAAGEPADTFANTARRHVAERCAGEDPAERRRRQRARRELSIKQQPDGMYKLFGAVGCCGCRGGGTGWCEVLPAAGYVVQWQIRPCSQSWCAWWNATSIARSLSPKFSDRNDSSNG